MSVANALVPHREFTAIFNGARKSRTNRRMLSWTLANFRCSETAALQVFPMPAGIFARSRARPGPTKNSVYPYILGHFAHPPLRKMAKVKLIAETADRHSGSALLDGVFKADAQ